MPRFIEDRGYGAGAAYTVPPDATIVALCKGCGHVTVLSRDRLAALGLEYEAFIDFQHRLKCSACGLYNGKITTGRFVD